MKASCLAVLFALVAGAPAHGYTAFTCTYEHPHKVEKLIAMKKVDFSHVMLQLVTGKVKLKNLPRKFFSYEGPAFLKPGKGASLEPSDQTAVIWLTQQASNPLYLPLLREFLMHEATDINYKTRAGWTPLMVAARHAGRGGSATEVFDLILAQDPDVNLQNKDGNSALMLAARYAASDSSLRTMEQLLLHDANPNLQNKEGSTALMLAARYAGNKSSLAAVQLLTEHGAKLDLQNNEGYTALMHAARYASAESSEAALDHLLKSGANVNLQNKHGDTALMLASYASGRGATIGAVQQILGYQPKIGLRNTQQETAMHYAIRNRHEVWPAFQDHIQQERLPLAQMLIHDVLENTCSNIDLAGFVLPILEENSMRLGANDWDSLAKLARHNLIIRQWLTKNRPPVQA